MDGGGGVGGKNRETAKMRQRRGEEREGEQEFERTNNREKAIQIKRQWHGREGEIERLAHRLAEIISH